MLLDDKGFMLSIYKALLLVVVIALQLLIAKFRKRHPRKPLTDKGNDKETKPTSVLEDAQASIVRHCLGERTVC